MGSVKIPILKFFLLVLVSILSHSEGQAKPKNPAEEEEVLVLVSVSRIGHFEINALVEGQQLKLPVARLLSFLQFPHQWTSPAGELQVSLPGQEPVQLTPSGRFVRQKGTTLVSPAEAFRYVSGEYFLALPLWDSLFGIKAVFHFHDLVVQMEASFGLSPLASQPQHTDKPGRAVVSPDLIFSPTPYLLRGGALDYQLNYFTQGAKGIAEAQIKAGAGAFGGNLQAGLFLRTAERFDWQRQQFAWSMHRGRSSFLRNIRAGHIGGPSILRTFSPHLGLMLNNIPDTLQAGKWYYQFQAGKVLAGGAWFARPEITYRAGAGFSTGLGIEYHTAMDKPIWFVNARYSPIPGYLFHFEHATCARTLIYLSGRPLPGLSAAYSFERYQQGNQFLFSPFPERHRLEITARLRLSRTWGGATLDADWQRGQQYALGSFQCLFFMYWKQSRLFISSRINVPSPLRGGLFSTIGLDQRLGRKSTLRLESRFHGAGLRGYGFEVEYTRRILRDAEIIAGYQEGFTRGQGMFQLQFSCNLGAVRSFTSIFARGRQPALAQGLSGSLFFQDGRAGIQARAEPVTGRGGLLVCPFVDIDHNTRRDPGEPVALGASASLEGRQSMQAGTEGTIRFGDLPAGREYTLFLEPGNMEDVFWNFRYKIIQVRVEPAQYQRVEVPVQPGHEIYGYLQEENNRGSRTARKVYLFDHSGRQLRDTWTNAADGSFAFSPLPPGKYIISAENSPKLAGAVAVAVKPTLHGQQIGPLHLDGSLK